MLGQSLSCELTCQMGLLMAVWTIMKGGVVCEGSWALVSSWSLCNWWELLLMGTPQQ